MPANLPDLGKAVERGLKWQDKDRDNSVLHVTDLATVLPGEGCPRQLWLRLHGRKERELTPGQRLMFWHGNRIHEDLAELLHTGLPSEWEITAIEKDVEADGVIGRLDCLLYNPASGSYIVVDFKTSRGRAFGYLDDVKPAHKLQVQAYMYALSLTGIEPEAGIVFYVDREGQNAMKQFTVQRNDGGVKDAIAETKDIAEGPEPDILEPKLDIRENKGPDSVKLKQPWQCDYCNFLDVSCKGALPYEWRDLGIVAKIDNGQIWPVDKVPEGAISLVESIMEMTAIPF